MLHNVIKEYIYIYILIKIYNRKQCNNSSFTKETLHKIFIFSSLFSDYIVYFLFTYLLILYNTIIIYIVRLYNYINGKNINEKSILDLF